MRCLILSLLTLGGIAPWVFLYLTDGFDERSSYHVRSSEEIINYPSWFCARCDTENVETDHCVHCGKACEKVDYIYSSYKIYEEQKKAP